MSKNYKLIAGLIMFGLGCAGLGYEIGSKRAYKKVFNSFIELSTNMPVVAKMEETNENIEEEEVNE